MNTRQNKHLWGALSLVAMAAMARLIPHPANVTPLVAMALFSGAAFSSRRKFLALLVPLAALFISDLALGFHNQMVSVYGSVILISMIGFALSDKRSVAGASGKRSVAGVAGATLLSSVVFFVVTNFTVWLSGGFYAHTVQGLIECYTLALPFFRNAVLGDLVFSGLLFGAWSVVAAASPAESIGSPSKVKGNI